MSLVHGIVYYYTIMAKESSSNTLGIPSLEYNPADKMPQLNLLHHLCSPLEDLKNALLTKYRGKRLRMSEMQDQWTRTGLITYKSNAIK